MKIGGWRTRSVFERYAIVSRSDMNDAILKLQECENRVEQLKKFGTWPTKSKAQRYDGSDSRVGPSALGAGHWASGFPLLSHS